jgi:hypothetical protein
VLLSGLLPVHGSRASWAAAGSSCRGIPRLT